MEMLRPIVVDPDAPLARANPVAKLAAAAILGGLIALLLVALIDPRGALTHFDIVAVTVGVFGGMGLDRLIRG